MLTLNIKNAYKMSSELQCVLGSRLCWEEVRLLLLWGKQWKKGMHACFPCNMHLTCISWILDMLNML